MDSYDYVIVGAGSAGCVLANKLGEDKKHRILVLEAGPMDSNLMIHIPAGVYKAYRNPKTNWNYLTEDEPELFNRKVPMPRGKVVGGSSSINSMVYMRGHPLDYDRWQSECGLKEWSYDQCLPYFKEGENSDRGEDEWRGGSGNLGVSKGSFENPLFEAFEEAGRQSGQGYSEDLNGYNPEGIARLDATRKHGRRCSAAVAHLRPALARGNVTLLTKSQVLKINMTDNSVSGVTFKHRGETRSVKANKALFTYRQVSIIDPLVTRLVIEVVTYIVVFCIILAVMAWIGFDIEMQDFLAFLMINLLLILLGLGMGILLCVASAYWEDTTKVVSMVMAPMFILSGIFFTATMIPQKYHYLFDWNPIFHVIELTRQAMFISYTSPVGDWQFVALCALVTNAAGLMLYQVSRQRFIAS